MCVYIYLNAIDIHMMVISLTTAALCIYPTLAGP